MKRLVEDAEEGLSVAENLLQTVTEGATFSQKRFRCYNRITCGRCGRTRVEGRDVCFCPTIFLSKEKFPLGSNETNELKLMKN